MNLQEIIVEGTLKPDGTLELDRKANLSPGRVTVVLRQETEVFLPKDDPFWQRMRSVWDAQKTQGLVPRRSEEIEAQQREMRAGWAKRQEAIERLQEESRKRRQNEGESPS